MHTYVTQNKKKTFELETPDPDIKTVMQRTSILYKPNIISKVVEIQADLN